jgi:hypothetical protein
MHSNLAVVENVGDFMLPASILTTTPEADSGESKYISMLKHEPYGKRSVKYA